MRKRHPRQNSDRNLYIRFFALVGAIIVLLVLTYFVGIAVLGNLNLIMGTARPTVDTNHIPILPPPRLYSVPQATYSAQIKVEGYAQPGSTVTLFVNEVSVGSLVSNKEGQYVFDNVALQDGENQIYAIAKDKEGAESKPSNTLRIIYDNQPPELTIESPEDNQVVRETEGEPVSVLVRGSVSEWATVTINGQQAILNQNYQFEQRFNLTQEGENTLKIQAVDRAGNKTTVEKIIILEKEAAPPS